MAGDWVKWEKGLENKPEVVRMASLLKKSRREVAVDCMNFWAWADENIPEESISENGSAFVSLSPTPGDNMALIDDIVGTPLFADSIARVGWLRFRDERIEFPNFGRHNGETAKTRARNAKNQKKKRSKPSPQPNPNNSPEKTPPPVPVTNLSPSSGDISVTRGEERRVNNEFNTQPTPLLNPHADSARNLMIEIEGEDLEFNDNPLLWVAEFIQLWDRLPGVRKHGRSALTSIDDGHLRRRLLEPEWHWKRAFKLFPLYLPEKIWNITLGRFLSDPQILNNILGGQYERAEQAGLFSGSKQNDPTRVRTGNTVATIAAARARAEAGSSEGL